uniref:Uncharacterized protein n=1 Tax=Anguilla anguilla TaxID=7936 RepID=A0A0E9R4S1_ANGAN
MFFEMNNAEINLTKWYKFKYVRFPYGYTAVITKSCFLQLNRLVFLTAVE